MSASDPIAQTKFIILRGGGRPHMASAPQHAGRAVERWSACSHARLRGLPSLPDHGDRRRGQRAHAFHRSAPEIAVGAESRTRWRALYEEVRRRHRAGETLAAIGRVTGLARGTVRKYAHAEGFPERVAHGPGPSRLDPYVAHLERRMAEGCEDAMALWREVRRQGYDGTPRQVQRFVAERREAPASRTAHKWLDRSAPAGAKAGTTPALPSPRALAWLLVQPLAALPPHAAAAVSRVEQDAEAARVARLARRFTALVRGCGVGSDERPPDPCGAFDTWVAEARVCGVKVIETFAAGIENDGAAVRAALATPWSNAQAEGQITRLKMIKRQSYGRAGFDLLRRRVLLDA